MVDGGKCDAEGELKGGVTQQQGGVFTWNVVDIIISQITLFSILYLA